MICLPNTYKRHFIAHQWGQDIGCLYEFIIWSITCTLHWYMWCHAIISHIITRFLCIQDVRIHDLRELDKFIDDNTLSNVCSVAAICRQVHYIEWERPSLFHAAISLINRLEIVWMWDLSYRIIWIKFSKMLFVYVKCGTHRLIHWRIIVFLTQNPNVFMIVDINDAPKSGSNV